MLGFPYLLRVLFLVSRVRSEPVPFNRTCTEWAHNNTLLTGNCNAHVAAKTSALELNRCFANIDGALVPSDNGYFGNSCENVSVDKWLDGTKTSLAPVFLRADCRNKSGKLLSAAIEISAPEANVINDDGQLKCYDREACLVNMGLCINCGETGGLKPPKTWPCK